MGKAAGGGGEKWKHLKGKGIEVKKGDAVTNAFRLLLHNFAYTTFKIKVVLKLIAF
jgi:hypothetical protein